MSERPKTEVFFSYTRRQPDEDWAARLLPILSRRFGLDVWVDKRNIRGGVPYDSEIEAAITRSEAIIFLGSSASVASTYCRDECMRAHELGKSIVPLFIEDVGWGIFPDEFQKLHYEQIQRADDDETLAAMVGQRLIEASLPIDPALVPERKPGFDIWAGEVHPPYEKLMQASRVELRGFVDECARKLKLSPTQGYHTLNLALLFLKLGEYRLAADYAKKSLVDLPGRAEAHYFDALIQAAASPLSEGGRARIERIITSLETASSLADHDAARRAGESAWPLPLLLKGAVAAEYYARNGLISKIGTSETLFAEAGGGQVSKPEVERLIDSLQELSPRTKAQIAAAGGLGR